MMNMYRETDYRMPFGEKLFYIVLIVLFAAGVSLALFSQVKAEAKADNLMKPIGEYIVVDGVEYEAEQFVPNASRMMHRINAEFFVNTVTNQIIVQWNANAFRGSEQTLDTGLIYETPDIPESN